MNMLFIAFAILSFSLFFFHVFWVGWGVVDELFYAWSSNFKTIVLFPVLYSFGSLILGYGLVYHIQYSIPQSSMDGEHRTM